MNKYEIIGIVGEGAYGIVYKAKNKDTGQYGKLSLHVFSNNSFILECLFTFEQIFWHYVHPFLPISQLNTILILNFVL